MEEVIKKVIDEKIDVLNRFREESYIAQLKEICQREIKALKSGNKILIAGNGGSAADAQHFAAELVGRFETERKGLPAIALTTDTSILTSVGNDYSYDHIFARQVEALALPGDIFIGISTSGNSENIVCAVEKAKKEGLFVIGLLGKDGGRLKDICDEVLIVPSDKTARIQELHEMCIHIMCTFIDDAYRNS